MVVKARRTTQCAAWHCGWTWGRGRLLLQEPSPSPTPHPQNNRPLPATPLGHVARGQSLYNDGALRDAKNSSMAYENEGGPWPEEDPTHSTQRSAMQICLWLPETAPCPPRPYQGGPAPWPSGQPMHFINTCILLLHRTNTADQADGPEIALVIR
jgi:hypothetical protein